MENRYNIMIKLFSILFILLTSCADGNKQNIVSTKKIVNNHSNKADSINGKPVKFYMENKNCSQVAKDFYNGKFIPSDNDSTEILLNLSFKSDSILRPFYFWCLNSIINEADGALMEYIGIPARRYIEKYPMKYFVDIHTEQFKKNKNNWITSINYSGYYENENSEDKIKIKKIFISKILKNCINCNTSLKSEINIFAEECFGK
jgi:hypothetical protein